MWSLKFSGDFVVCETLASMSSPRSHYWWPIIEMVADAQARADYPREVRGCKVDLPGT